MKLFLAIVAVLVIMVCIALFTKIIDETKKD